MFTYCVLTAYFTLYFSVIMAENSMSEIAIGEVFGPVILRPSHENLTYVVQLTYNRNCCTKYNHFKIFITIFLFCKS
jgi:hypothetical protein